MGECEGDEEDEEEGDWCVSTRCSRTPMALPPP